MTKPTKLTNDLLNFLDHSPTAFHAATLVMDRLKKNGFEELREVDHWDMKPGGSYAIQRNSSSVIAWKICPDVQPPVPFSIALSHLDSPGLRLKMRSLIQQGNTLVAPVEKYSSNIDTTWFDHPLTIAGRVVLTDGEERIIHFPQPTAIIPNVAIHLQRDVNQGVHLNPQTQMSALLGNTTPQELLEEIARLAQCDINDLAELELALADATPAAVVGLKGDMINSPRLDNLMAAHAMLVAMEEPKTPTQAISIAFFADNEEIGNNTRTGADSHFLADTLMRINLALGGNQEDYFRALAASTLLSIDAAHAFHPNFPEKYDRTTAPVINGGITLKTNPNGRYITNAPTAAWFEKLCIKARVPFQFFATRSDMPCGSTVGPTTSARLGIEGVDIGNPMWAMHSVRETAGLEDQKHMAKLLKFYLNK